VEPRPGDPPDPAAPTGPERVDAILALAGDVALDVARLATELEGCTRRLLERTAPGDPSREAVDEIRRAGERSGLLARRLLALVWESGPAPLAHETTGSRSSDVVASRALGGRTVLLVEDDDDLRFVAKTALVERGGRVLEARDGLEALAVAERTEQPVDVLVTDVRMPRMEGVELTESMLAKRPTLHVLVMTGFAADDVLGSMPRTPRLRAIEKPFTPDQLADAVVAMLGPAR